MQAEADAEERRPGSAAKVRTPTQQEKEDHFIGGHARYRNWCPHCAAAKGQGTPHTSRQDNQSELPELGFDYFYLGDRQNTGLPNIEGKDRVTGSFAGTTLEAKGRNTYAVAYLVGWIRGLGYKRFVARSDNEPSILALLRDVSAAMPEVEMIMKSSPEGDHQQNGLAEVGVREVKGQARVLKSELEFNYKRRLDVDEPLLAWIVRHGANAINRGRIGQDGPSTGASASAGTSAPSSSASSASSSQRAAMRRHALEAAMHAWSRGCTSGTTSVLARHCSSPPTPC